MKTLRTTLCLLVFTLSLASFTTANASVAVPQEKTTEMLQQKAAEQHEGFASQVMTKMEKHFAKKAEKMQKRLAKRFGNGEKVDFNDPVEKWFWFWLLGWAAGIVLYTIGFAVTPFWYLGYLCWVAGTVCLVIWLLKKSGNM